MRMFLVYTAGALVGVALALWMFGWSLFHVLEFLFDSDGFGVVADQAGVAMLWTLYALIAVLVALIIVEDVLPPIRRWIRRTW